MNKRMVLYMLGKILMLESALLILPFVCALIYKEDISYCYVYTIAIAAAAGALLMFIGRPRNKAIFAKEGFAIVALTWIFMSAIGALPFIFSGVSFLLCGFLAVRKNKIPAVYASGGAGLLVLLVLIALLAILSGGNMSNLVWILVAVGLVCPFLGGVLARKI